MTNENLSVYDRICRTRKSGRATASDYINATITDFVELHGDRCFADDHAIVGGIGRLNGKPVTVIGIEKGRDLNERLLRNFGCVLPEGYRKALRLIKQAEKFHRPVICLLIHRVLTAVRAQKKEDRDRQSPTTCMSLQMLRHLLYQ